jgi:hypothetical protein
MDTKTKAFIELACGFGFILIALFFVIGIMSIEDVYLLGTNLTRPIKELAAEYMIAGLMFGFLGGISITKAYYALSGKRPYEKKKP